MSARGGSRPGSGRPKGGISHTRRMLVSAITKGMALAAEDKGQSGSVDDLAGFTAAEIVRGLVHAGRGDEVLKLYALTAPKSNEPGGGSDGDSPLDKALEAMPGMSAVPESSQLELDETDIPPESVAYSQSATDSKSVEPYSPLFGQGQFPLLSGFGQETSAPAHAQAGEAPHPPSPVLSDTIRVSTENFEKNSLGAHEESAA